MKPGTETEPGHPTLAEAVRRAVDVVDPTGRSDGLADLERRFEDRDEPMSAVLPVLEQTLAEEKGKIDPQDEDGAVVLAAAVITYLGYRRDEVDDEREDIVRLAVKAEFDGRPPPVVEDWLREEGLEIR
jgi:hypothetical protein